MERKEEHSTSPKADGKRGNVSGGRRKKGMHGVFPGPKRKGNSCISKRNGGQKGLGKRPYLEKKNKKVRFP